MQLCGAVTWSVPNGVMLKAANRSRGCSPPPSRVLVGQELCKCVGSCLGFFCLFVSFARANCEALLMGEQKNKDACGCGSRSGLLLTP